jgi:hypothetical protein
MLIATHAMTPFGREKTVWILETELRWWRDVVIRSQPSDTTTMARRSIMLV